MPEGDKGLLSPGETRQLLDRAQKGEKEAEEQLVQANRRLVASVVRRFLGRGYEEEDLFQLGALGLLKAVHRFDLSRPVQFSTFAVPWIIGEIRSFLRDDHPVKIGRESKETAGKLLHLRDELGNKLGREPSLQEVAAASGMDIQEVVSALDAVAPLISLQTIISAEEENPIQIQDGLAVEEDLSGTIDRLVLNQVLSQIGEAERQVVVLRFFREKSQTEVARMLGASQAWVSRTEKRALQRMRQMLEA